MLADEIRGVIDDDPQIATMLLDGLEAFFQFPIRRLCTHGVCPRRIKNCEW
jgi:hypothetical protein